MEPVGSSEAEFLLLRLNRTPERPDDFGYQVLTAGAGGFFILGTVLLMPLKTTGRGPSPVTRALLRFLSRPIQVKSTG